MRIQRTPMIEHVGKICGLLGSIVSLNACGDASVVAEQSEVRPEALPVSESRAADALLAAVQERFSVRNLQDPDGSWSPPFESARRLPMVGKGADLVPELAETAAVAVSVPKRADGAFSVRDNKTGIQARVRLRGALDRVGEVARGAIAYAGGHELGDLILRPGDDGIEDYVVVKDGRSSRLEYEVELSPEVAGLRLVGNSLELLDESGDPRLQVAPPLLVDAKGQMRGAVIAVSGCEYDTSSKMPWGRTVTPPNSAACALSVTWDASGLHYPLLVDPSWGTTLTMSPARRSHVTSKPAPFSGGLVLVAGGRTGNLALSSAKIYNPSAGGTWTSTASMSVARYQAVHMNQFADTGQGGFSNDYVLVAGGQDMSVVHASAERYNFTSGTWQSAGSMSKERYAAAAASPDTGKVLVAGGSWIGTQSTCPLPPCVASNAEVYTFATNSWGPISASVSPRKSGHTLTRLAPGFGPSPILQAGGDGGDPKGCERYDLAANSWTPVANLALGVTGHTAVLCEGCPAPHTDKIFVLGGVNSQGPVSTVQFYNLSTNAWTPWGSMLGARFNHGSVLYTDPQGNKRILVAGGESTVPGAGQLSGVTVKTSWIWPIGGGPNMITERARFGMVRLMGATPKVLVTGGIRSQSNDSIGQSELFTP